jgi:hypothetical protein
MVAGPYQAEGYEVLACPYGFQVDEQLFIWYRTVRYHFRDEFVKLGGANRALIRAGMVGGGGAEQYGRLTGQRQMRTAGRRS